MIQKILAAQKYDVVLTRTKDHNISLTERSEFANQNQADLYISIHANASPVQSHLCHGIETYYVDFPTSSKPSQDVGYLSFGIDNNQIFQSIESRYFKKNTRTSQRLAETLQSNIVNHLKKTDQTIHDRGIKTAPLKNLLRSIIPTVYVEVGFLSHQEEAQKLANTEYQQKLAEGISHGIKEFIKNRKNVSV